jgi:hypothetical protein
VTRGLTKADLAEIDRALKWQAIGSLEWAAEHEATDPVGATAARRSARALAAVRRKVRTIRGVRRESRRSFDSAAVRFVKERS